MRQGYPTYKRCRTNSRQKGAALAISLIFLVIITILSVSAMRTTNLDTKITVNHQFKELSFQAAESALAMVTTPDPPDVLIPDSVPDTTAQNPGYFSSAATADQPGLSADLTMTYLYGLTKDEPATPDTPGINVSGYPLGNAFNTYLATAEGFVAQSGTHTTNRMQVVLISQ
ncbi:MAG: PilX N-terminal domain-containing pilus assembly protein [Candidatus Thiodiazotropha endolucinida]